MLHTDSSVLPQARRAWAAWNYQRAASPGAGPDEARVCLHYLINRLQPLPFDQPVLVSLNPLSAIEPGWCWVFLTMRIRCLTKLP